MMTSQTRYVWLGVGLLVGGAIFSLAAWLVVESVPLVALGLAAILIGIVALALSRALPAIPPEASGVLLQTGLENLSALLEEIGLTTPALYLPSRLARGKPLALIPLSASGSDPSIQGPLPDRLIVSYGRRGELGLLVRTAGTTVAQLLDERPGPSTGELESAIGAALVGRLDLARGVHVYRDGERFVAEVDDPRLGRQDLWATRSLGSPLASIVAALVAEGTDQPVAMRSEDWQRRQVVIVLELVRDGL